jgi:hypothetical protein
MIIIYYFKNSYYLKICYNNEKYFLIKISQTN